MYTGNYTTLDEFKFVSSFEQFLLNLDDVSNPPTVASLGVPEFLSFRINPDMQPTQSCVTLAGQDAKYGVPWEHAVDAYRQAQQMGVERFGIHMMTGTNILDEGYFVTITEKLFDVMGHIKQELGIDFTYINIGGGFGVPYHPSEPTLDIEHIAINLREVFDHKCKMYGLAEPALMIEPGRFITANAGYLVSQVHVVKQSYKKFVGIDAGMNDLIRPELYKSYHHLSVLNKNHNYPAEVVNVVGRLCENTDQFARDRNLPCIDINDTIVIHTAGGHGYV